MSDQLMAPPLLQQEKSATIGDVKDALRVIEVRSSLDKICILNSKPVAEKAKDEPVEVTAGFEELDRTANELCLKYAVSIGRERGAQTIELEGKATVIFSKGVSESALANNVSFLNIIVSSIFSDNYGPIHLLSVSLRLAPPAPGLLETVHLLQQDQKGTDVRTTRWRIKELTSTE